MLILSHRGNLHGPGQRENEPAQIEECLAAGFGVEVDLWRLPGGFFLGHDAPQYPLELARLDREGVFFHLKSPCVPELIRADAFAICADPYALTLRGRLWANYGTPCSERAIVCAPELVGAKESLESFLAGQRKAYAVCTDYPLEARRILARLG